MLPTALIDADTLLYQVSFIYEKVDFAKHHFTNRIRTMIENTIFESGCVNAKLFVAGSKEKNFRYNINALVPYKGNRKQEKPKMLPLAIDFVKQYFNTVESDGAEADDYVVSAHLADPDNTVMCTADKDFKQVPNTFYYDYLHKVFVNNSNRSAFMFWVSQVVVGDSCDNIPGIYGISYNSKILYKFIDEYINVNIPEIDFFNDIFFEQQKQLVLNCAKAFVRTRVTDDFILFKPKKIKVNLIDIDMVLEQSLELVTLRRDFYEK